PGHGFSPPSSTSSGAREAALAWPRCAWAWGRARRRSWSAFEPRLDCFGGEYAVAEGEVAGGEDPRRRDLSGGTLRAPHRPRLPRQRGELPPLRGCIGRGRERGRRGSRAGPAGPLDPEDPPRAA